MTGSHFHYGQLMLRLEAEQGERHTDGVVQIAFGIKDMALALQHGCYQLLGRGFAVGSRDADDKGGELLAVVVG